MIDKIEKREEKSLQYRLILWSFYAVAVVMKNIFATKTWRFGFLHAPAGYIFEPITFIAQDVETETRGYDSAKSMIFWGFVLNIVVAITSQLAIFLPNASDSLVQSSFEIVLGNVPRILIASMIAYLIGGTLNSKIMHELKLRGNNSLFFRVIVSTVFGQFIDNILFASVAFIGIMTFREILYMAFTMTILETLYEICFYPVTKFCIRKINEVK